MELDFALFTDVRHIPLHVSVLRSVSSYGDRFYFPPCLLRRKTLRSSSSTKDFFYNTDCVIIAKEWVDCGTETQCSTSAVAA